MRKWKFRGWDATGRKGWVYGDLVHAKGLDNSNPVFLYDRIMVGGYEVVPESVGVYSGHIDSHGIEIYEGDYIKDDWGIVNVLVWDDKAAGLYLKYEDFYSTFMDKEFEHLEVIGNEYEDNHGRKEEGNTR